MFKNEFSVFAQLVPRVGHNRSWKEPQIAFPSIKNFQPCKKVIQGSIWYVNKISRMQKFSPVKLFVVGEFRDGGRGGYRVATNFLNFSSAILSSSLCWHYHQQDLHCSGFLLAAQKHFVLSVWDWYSELFSTYCILWTCENSHWW